MRKIFLLALLMCMLLLTAVAEAAQITDVKWGVDKNNVPRLVVDITDELLNNTSNFAQYLCNWFDLVCFTSIKIQYYN